MICAHLNDHIHFVSRVYPSLTLNNYSVRIHLQKFVPCLCAVLGSGLERSLVSALVAIADVLMFSISLSLAAVPLSRFVESMISYTICVS